MTKEQIKTINKVAIKDINEALVMLAGINLVLGTEYTILNRRVVYKDSSGYHDEFVNAE